MVLAAGLGTRLRPLTERWPKPAMPFLGAPLIRYGMAVLQRAGVEAVGINTHHLPEVMAATGAAEAARAGLGFEVVHEAVLQGTGGGIRGLKDFLTPSETFVVLNGDILFAVELAPLLKQHRESGAAATMVLLPMPAGETYAAVECDAQMNVRRIAGHGPGGAALSPWHFSGVHLMTPEVFRHMSPHGPEDINREVYPRMLAAGLRLRGVVAAGYWSDLGTPSRYLATVRDVLFGQVPLDDFGASSPLAAVTALPGVRNAMRAGAQVEGSVTGPALFDTGSQVAPGASIGSAVYVGPGARVGAGARLNRVVVFEDTEIGPGEALVETLAWKEHRIPAPL